MRQVIACGHTLTAEAASHALGKGGNAFDAIVAACFASSVVEPMLTTLAGGGIGLLRPDGEETVCVDFLAGFPKAAKDPPVQPIRKVVSFGGETQVFNLGYGSLGVPGTLQGLLHIHERYCTLDLADILSPAIVHAKGHKLNRLQAFTFRILEPFCLYTEEARRVFAPRGELLQEGQTIRNPDLASFLSRLSEEGRAALPYYLDEIGRTLEGKESTLSMEDVMAYEVAEHDPISISYRGKGIELSSPPSAGGALVAWALKHMEGSDVGSMQHNSAGHIRLLVDAMKEADSQRTQSFFEGLLFDEAFTSRIVDRLGGTTHISVIDKDGNAAGITTSNGQGSGIMAGRTGIMLNNFAAEPDLMQYKEIYRPGGRITSMMSPTMISGDGALEAVLGTGGSNRIRSAIMQTASNLIDFRMSPQQATDAPRVHFEFDVLQMEGGIGKGAIEELGKEYEINAWTERNLYFGGVHIASKDGGGGDPRRGGAVIAD